MLRPCNDLDHTLRRLWQGRLQIDMDVTDLLPYVEASPMCASTLGFDDRSARRGTPTRRGLRPL